MRIDSVNMEAGVLWVEFSSQDSLRIYWLKLWVGQEVEFPRQLFWMARLSHFAPEICKMVHTPSHSYITYITQFVDHVLYVYSMKRKDLMFAVCLLECLAFDWNVGFN